MFCKAIDIWSNFTYLSEGKDGFRPTLHTYILEGEKKRGAVVICPGGGYSIVSDREWESVALKFVSAGFHAFVLNYSVAPKKHPQPILDLSRALCIIRENSNKWNVDKNNIAVCGFSAGGHLAASLGVHWNKDYLYSVNGIVKGENKPNYLILAYPVITSGEFAHKQSIENLLGGSASKQMLLEMSLEKQVNKDTPETFIWHTFEDNCVPLENTLLFANGLRKNNIRFEMHIFPKGGHGLSLGTEETATQELGIYPHASKWMELCIEWLKGER